MGLKVFDSILSNSDEVILASDVEKMLRGGERSGSCSGGHITSHHLKLTIPQKPKPVSKGEIIEALSSKHLEVVMNTHSTNKIYERFSGLIERIEKAGIE